MTDTKQQMKLGAFLFNFGHHYAAWRYPGTRAERLIDMDFYRQVARTAERGRMDMLFLADSSSVPHIQDTATDVSFLYPESTSVLGALSSITEHIGLAATVSTTFNEPYNLARRFATLDHLSGGRTAWNVVTGTKEAEARNFNRDTMLEHGLRYARAQEFLDVVSGLWDSWEDEAVLFDKEAGVFADTKRIHPIHHRGASFSVEGPLNIPRSPQGRPVIIQAGTSESGQQLAARTAEVVFTACEDKTKAVAFYKQLKALLTQYGRDAGQLKIMPGLLTFIGKTEEEARQKQAEFNALVPPEIAVSYLSKLLNLDVSGYPLDEPLPELSMEGNTSRAHLIMEMSRQKNMTIRELGLHFAVARGHLVLCGTAEQIADQMEDWFASGACDGFNIMPPYLPGGLEDFVDQVIPVLQRRGLFRTEYTGRTLREHLGLDRPVSRFTALAQT